MFDSGCKVKESGSLPINARTNDTVVGRMVTPHDPGVRAVGTCGSHETAQRSSVRNEVNKVETKPPLWGRRVNSRRGRMCRQVCAGSSWSTSVPINPDRDCKIPMNLVDN